MSEIEVGEYVRTKNGYIIRVDENTNVFNLGYKEQYLDMETTRYGFICEEEIAKHSKQLIDLIEVGDIVKDKYNKYEVAFVKDDKIYCNDYNLDDSLITLREQDIKEILAREQFEANCYKAGGEEDESN